jgi:hypothetical protein
VGFPGETGAAGWNPVSLNVLAGWISICFELDDEHPAARAASSKRGVSRRIRESV